MALTLKILKQRALQVCQHSQMYLYWKAFCASKRVRGGRVLVDSTILQWCRLKSRNVDLRFSILPSVWIGERILYLDAWGTY